MLLPHDQGHYGPKVQSEVVMTIYVVSKAIVVFHAKSIIMFVTICIW